MVRPFLRLPAAFRCRQSRLSQTMPDQWPLAPAAAGHLWRTTTTGPTLWMFPVGVDSPPHNGEVR